MSFYKFLLLVICSVLVCFGQDELSLSRSQRIDNEPPLLSGSDKESHWREKSEEQLQKTTPCEHKIKANTSGTKRGGRIPRQSENSPLDNLRSIAAGKGSISRVRSRARGRLPARTDIPQPTASTTARPRPKKVESTVENLEMENIVSKDKEITKVDDIEDIPHDTRQGSNFVDTRRIRTKSSRRKKKKHPVHRQPDLRYSQRTFRSKQRQEARFQKHVKRVKEIEDREDQPVTVLTGCHQVCDTLIFEVYKLLRGKHCDCY